MSKIEHLKADCMNIYHNILRMFAVYSLFPFPWLRSLQFTEIVTVVVLFLNFIR